MGTSPVEVEQKIGTLSYEEFERHVDTALKSMMSVAVKPDYFVVYNFSTPLFSGRYIKDAVFMKAVEMYGERYASENGWRKWDSSNGYGYRLFRSYSNLDIESEVPRKGFLSGIFRR